MSTYNFHGNISGPANFGDNGRIEINNGADPAAVLDLADRLVERLGTDSPALVGEAEVIRGELVRAGQEGRVADRGRIRSALETIGIGVAAGSGGLALAQELGRALGI
ncbi:hypothetical protein [Streptomyces sp. NPDC045251]|uniref:hypothetical protein n=1 Tax=unclassified Streptomyces TaxID=2593676 RepID=UPI0033D1AD2D